MNITQEEIETNAPRQPLSEAEVAKSQMDIALNALSEISEGRAMFGINASEDLTRAIECATHALTAIKEQKSR